MITKEILLAKKAELEKEQEQLTANLNAIGGALQFCNHLLNMLNEPQEVKDEIHAD